MVHYSKEVIGVMEGAGRLDGNSRTYHRRTCGFRLDRRGKSVAVSSPSFDRTTVFGGREVAKRKASSWTVLDSDGMESIQGNSE
jgi:hypothetical protein